MCALVFSYGAGAGVEMTYSRSSGIRYKIYRPPINIPIPTDPWNKIDIGIRTTSANNIKESSQGHNRYTRYEIYLSEPAMPTIRKVISNELGGCMKDYKDEGILNPWG